jgi:hypothetical protein
MDILADLGRSNMLLGRQVDTPAPRFRDLDGIFHLMRAVGKRSKF